MCPDGPKARLRISAAFPAKPLRPPVTCFRRKRISSTITAIELRVAAAFAAGPAVKHVQDFHLIPLFSRTRMRVRSPPGTGSRICHKSRMQYSICAALCLVSGRLQYHYSVFSQKSKMDPKLFSSLFPALVPTFQNAPVRRRDGTGCGAGPFRR